MVQIKAYINRELQTLKRLNPKQRRLYIWDYYKVAIISAILILMLLIYLLIYNTGRAKTVLYVVMVNSNYSTGIDKDTGIPPLFKNLLAEEGYDTGVYRADVDCSFRYKRNDMTEESAYTLQALAALFSVGNLDLFISDSEVFDIYAGYDGFANLGQLLPEETLKSYAGSIRWCKNDKGETVAAGIVLDNTSPFIKDGFYSDTAVVGIAAQAENTKLAVKTLVRLLDEQ